MDSELSEDERKKLMEESIQRLRNEDTSAIGAAMLAFWTTYEADMKEVKASLARLEKATPSAADIPNVYVLGDEAEAREKGTTSTWTVVKARTKDVNAKTEKEKKA